MASTKAAMQSIIEDLRAKLDYAEQQCADFSTFKTTAYNVATTLKDEIVALREENQRLTIKLRQQIARGNAKAEAQAPKYFKPTPELLALAAQTYPGCNSFTRDQLLALQ